MTDIKRVLTVLALAGAALTVTVNAHAATSPSEGDHVGGDSRGIIDPPSEGVLPAALNGQPFHYTRVTRQRDLVPIVPWRFMGFMHAQHELFLPIDNNNQRYCGTKYLEDSICVNVV